MTDHLKLISILVPCYNEQATLPMLITRLKEVTQGISHYRFEFVFVDDGSNDDTATMLESLSRDDPRIGFVLLARNFGKETAMLAGFDAVRGDATVILDADLQDPPELISEMITYWEQGFDDVYAQRRSRQGETWMKKQTSKAFYRLLQRITDVPVQEDTGDFRLLDRKCIEALRQLRESNRYTKGMFSWIGFTKKEILFDRDERVAGDTKWNYSKLINLAINGITSSTTVPLRFATALGFIVSTGAFIYIVVIVTQALLGVSGVDGYPSLMAVILFLGGVQLISLGIIGEYIGKIFDETKNRPSYTVREKHDSNASK